MIQRIELSPEQQKAYDRFITMRDRVKNAKKWVRPSPISHTIDVEGLNHPLYVVNDVYNDYLQAFQDWLMVEPQFREKERMRASRGDYGDMDNWTDKKEKVTEQHESKEPNNSENVTKEPQSSETKNELSEERAKITTSLASFNRRMNWTPKPQKQEP